jgi:flagellar protein FlgJ
MDPNRLGAGIGQVASGLATDSRSLDQLKRAARDDPRQAVKKVATQFEALFMQMVLKSMRDATPHAGLLDSQEQDMYRGMLDQQVAQQIAGKGTGLAELIARQLARNLPADAPPASGPMPAGASGLPGEAQAPGRHALQGAPASALLRFDFARSNPASAPRDGVGATERDGQPGRSGPVSTPADSPSAQAQHDFMQRHRADALRAQQVTGVPASFILGQAALESGWGRREIRGADGAPSYNLFGIKAGSGWHGRTVEVTTTEFDGGVARKTVQSFRAYDSYAAAFQDWALTIGRNQRYAGAVSAAGDAGGFAYGMQRGGYSTDPAYAEKLARVIRTASSIEGTG